MSRLLKPVICVCALVIMVLAVFPRQASAQGGCSIEVMKVALPPVHMSFDFAVDSSVDPPNEFSIPAGTHTNVFLIPGETDVVSEIVPDGWELIDVNCETSDPGFDVFVDDENKVIANCVSEGFSLCTFTDRGPFNVPTLSALGMISTSAGLGLIGVFFAIRRRGAVTK